MTDNPFVKALTPKLDANGHGDVVVLDRIEPDITPDYCAHGRVTCYWCSEWCWLGDKTHELVISGAAMPICLQCATRVIPRNSVPARNLHDHRRSEGPH